ncbi:Glutamate receptor-like 50, partial [Homarus americanus]
MLLIHAQLYKQWGATAAIHLAGSFRGQRRVHQAGSRHHPLVYGRDTVCFTTRCVYLPQTTEGSVLMVRLLEEVMEDPEVLRDVRDNPTTFRFKEGALMTVTTVHRPPHVTLINHQDGTYSITGPLAQLMDTVATSLNFTYRVVTPPDGTFGTATPNSSWSGMIGQVTRKEAMIALAPYATTWERYQAVDYLHHITHDYASMLNGKGRPEINPWGFVFPLQPLVWAALLAALVVAWLAIVLMGTKPVGSGHLT